VGLYGPSRIMNPDQPTNILLVDDDTANLLALEATLKGLNQNLVRASSGREALRQVLEKDFAVILLDVQMPEMNGIETAAAIRERERSRHIPIIFLTGLVKTDDMMFKGYSAGAVDYLVKPIVPDILRVKVGVFVELAQMRRKLHEEIAERSRAAAEISKLNHELEQKNKALTERTTELQETVSELESYSYSISHDMRAPLRAMMGYSQILLEESSQLLTEEHQGYLQRISTGARRLDHLIQDVLSYSKVSRATFQLDPIDVEKLIHEIIAQYPGLQSPQAEVKIEGPLPRVLANEAALTQCLSNLMDNAVKFVAPGITPKVTISAEQKGDEVRLWFVDNGIGIEPQDQERIFGIFVKVHSAETYPGTGIGLSIVRKAVEKMGGRIGLESKSGTGTRFWIQLQTADAALAGKG